ncbi:hypothetical protein [Crocosphaera sp. Alani8]|uniref:hypothetical protein n=1 Tax=Crocosphaera sp. Alani8 TaxID=3038952 RepID=UPI00313F32F1
MHWFQNNQPPKGDEDQPMISGNIQLKFNLKQKGLIMILIIIAPVFGLSAGPALRTEDIRHREHLSSHEIQLESETKTYTNSK